MRFLSALFACMLVTSAQAGTTAPPSSGSGSGSATPGGTNGQIEYNNNGAFGGITSVPVANGGTGATTAPAALTNLGGVESSGTYTSGDVGTVGNCAGVPCVLDGGTALSQLAKLNSPAFTGTPTVNGTAFGTDAFLGVGTGLTSTSSNLSVSYGTTAGTAAQGNDTRITGAVQSTATPGGGDITNTYGTPYVTNAGKAAGNADYINFLGAATNGGSVTSTAPEIIPAGSDAGINLLLGCKGNCDIQFPGVSGGAQPFYSYYGYRFITGQSTGYITFSPNGFDLATVSSSSFYPTPATATLGMSNHAWNVVYVNQTIASGSAPTITAGSAAGTSPTISITGTNMDGVISVTIGSSPANSATLATITDNGTLTSPPQGCVLQARNALTALADAMLYTTAPSTTSWTIGIGTSALTASTAYSWSYKCE